MEDTLLEYALSLLMNIFSVEADMKSSGRLYYTGSNTIHQNEFYTCESMANNNLRIIFNYK